MATEVDICNAALSLLGCRADVVSINPVEGGAHSERLAREYPIARNLVLESHDWAFAIRRASLALVRTDSNGWGYVYAKPSRARSVIAVLPEDDKYFENPQDFCVEIDPESGAELIYTDQENAVCRYTELAENANKYHESFRQAVTLLLASRMAGAVIKGTQGMQVAESMMKQFNVAFAQAKHFDQKQRRKTRVPSSSWTKAAERRI